MDRIYITGPIKGMSSEQLDEFVLAKQKLNELGHKQVVTAAEQLPDAESQVMEGVDALFLKVREKHRSEAEITVCLDDWERDIDSRREVNRSKQENKRVYGIRSFLQLMQNMKEAKHV